MVPLVALLTISEAQRQALVHKMGVTVPFYSLISDVGRGGGRGSEVSKAASESHYRPCRSIVSHNDELDVDSTG